MPLYSVLIEVFVVAENPAEAGAKALVACDEGRIATGMAKKISLYANDGDIVDMDARLQQQDAGKVDELLQGCNKIG